MKYITTTLQLTILLAVLSLPTSLFANNNPILEKEPKLKYLAEFNCDQIGDEIILDWFTLDDVDVKAFIIERSILQSNSFKEIGRINSENNNSEILYLFVDENPSLQNKYRIKIILKDNSFSYSKTLKIQNAEAYELGKK